MENNEVFLGKAKCDFSFQLGILTVHVKRDMCCDVYLELRTLLIENKWGSDFIAITVKMPFDGATFSLTLFEFENVFYPNDALSKRIAAMKEMVGNSASVLPAPKWWKFWK